MDEPTRCVRLIQPRPFDPLDLALDDRLEEDLRLVLGYGHRIDPRLLEHAVNAGIDAFPHLTGRLARGGGNGQWRILPTDLPLRLEVAEVRGPANGPHDEIASRFLPTEETETTGHALFAIRQTRCDDMDVLGLRVSHAAVDGSGLGWFAQCCAASAHGKVPPPVVHDRAVLLQNVDPVSSPLPPGYRDAGPLDQDWSWPRDPWTVRPPLVLSIPLETLRIHAGDGSLLALRIRLAALLATRLTEIAPELRELALWCDPRGTGGVPVHFTGNAGCYLHIPLRGMSEDRLAAGLRSVATRNGFQRVNRVFTRLRAAEAAGRQVVWDGPREDVLQVNLLPRVFEAADLGGLPVFGMLLSRNSSGLRISIAPDGGSFLIEASLADGWAEALFVDLQLRGFGPRPQGAARL